MKRTKQPKKQVVEQKAPVEAGNPRIVITKSSKLDSLETGTNVCLSQMLTSGIPQLNTNSIPGVYLGSGDIYRLPGTHFFAYRQQYSSIIKYVAVDKERKIQSNTIIPMGTRLYADAQQLLNRANL